MIDYAIIKGIRPYFDSSEENSKLTYKLENNNLALSAHNYFGSPSYCFIDLFIPAITIN